MKEDGMKSVLSELRALRKEVRALSGASPSTQPQPSALRQRLETEQLISAKSRGRLVAELESTKEALKASEGRSESATRRAQTTHQRLELQTRRLDDLLGSRAYRVGRLVRAAARAPLSLSDELRSRLSPPEESLHAAEETPAPGAGAPKPPPAPRQITVLLIAHRLSAEQLTALAEEVDTLVAEQPNLRPVFVVDNDAFPILQPRAHPFECIPSQLGEDTLSSRLEALAHAHAPHGILVCDASTDVSGLVRGLVRSLTEPTHPV